MRSELIRFLYRITDIGVSGTSLRTESTDSMIMCRSVTEDQCKWFDLKTQKTASLATEHNNLELDIPSELQPWQ